MSIASKKKKLRLKRFAKQLNANLPKSEVWFMKHFLPYKTIDDQFNVPFCSYIPDILNRKYRYIIEIDGSIHETEKQIKKDEKKNRAYRQSQFTVIRVKAYDMNSLNECLNKVCKLKGPYFKPAKIFKLKALVKTGSGPKSCMVKGDNLEGCSVEIKSGNESETI